MNKFRKRRLIRDSVKTAPPHPTAEWVYTEVKEEMPVSLLREVVRETFPEAEENAELPPVLLSGFCRECRKKRV